MIGFDISYKYHWGNGHLVLAVTIGKSGGIWAGMGTMAHVYYRLLSVLQQGHLALLTAVLPTPRELLESVKIPAPKRALLGPKLSSHIAELG